MKSEQIWCSFHNAALRKAAAHLAPEEAQRCLDKALEAARCPLPTAPALLEEQLAQAVKARLTFGTLRPSDAKYIDRQLCVWVAASLAERGLAQRAEASAPEVLSPVVQAIEPVLEPKAAAQVPAVPAPVELPAVPAKPAPVAVLAGGSGRRDALPARLRTNLSARGLALEALPGFIAEPVPAVAASGLQATSWQVSAAVLLLEKGTPGKSWSVDWLAQYLAEPAATEHMGLAVSQLIERFVARGFLEPASRTKNSGWFRRTPLAFSWAA